MIRKCPKCDEYAVKVKMLSFSNRMHCEMCFYQFEYTSPAKIVLGFMRIIIFGSAVSLGLFFESLVIFGLILILFPFVSELVFAKYCSLKPVGMRALRDRLHGKKQK